MIIETISVGRISEKDSGLHIAEIGLVFQAKNRYTNRVNPGHQPASLNSKKGSAERMKIERFSLLKRAVSWLLVLLFLTASLAAPTLLGSAHPGEDLTRNTVAWDERFRMDVWYIDHWSLVLDFKILLKTAHRVVARSGGNGHHALH